MGFVSDNTHKILINKKKLNHKQRNISYKIALFLFGKYENPQNPSLSIGLFNAIVGTGAGVSFGVSFRKTGSKHVGTDASSPFTFGLNGGTSSFLYNLFQSIFRKNTCF
eukprot:47104_1